MSEVISVLWEVLLVLMALGSIVLILGLFASFVREWWKARISE